MIYWKEVVQMADEKRRVKITIDDKEYTIVTNKSVAHVELVAETVNKQLDDLKSLSKGMPKEDLAMLMAVNAVSAQIDAQTKMIELENRSND